MNLSLLHDRPIIITHLTLLALTLLKPRLEFGHPLEKQLTPLKLHVFVPTVIAACGDETGVEPGHPLVIGSAKPNMHVYLNTLYMCPPKTVQMFVLRCLRLYKPLLHTIFSVHF